MIGEQSLIFGWFFFPKKGHPIRHGEEWLSRVLFGADGPWRRRCASLEGDDGEALDRCGGQGGSWAWCRASS